MPINRPTLPELEKALNRHWQSPPDDPAVARFHDRIAAHLETLLEREAALAGDFKALERKLLQSVPGIHGGADPNAQLCGILDQGIDPELLSRLIPVLLAIAREKLAIDNPRYLAAVPS